MATTTFGLRRVLPGAQHPERRMMGDHLGGRSPERELLIGFLDWYREIVVNKVDGLTLEQASRVMTPSGLSPLGIVRHLADVEAGWFVETFAGEEPPPDETDGDRFRLLADDTVASVTQLYREQVDRSRRIVAGAASLDDLSARAHGVFGPVSLRWILVHMLEETARHSGHLDLMREQLDGRIGD